jgi:hypothetical protein
VNALAQLSIQLERAGYSRSSDGTFLKPDRRRIVVLMEGDQDSAKWPAQVSVALTAPGVQQMAAWARYVVLVLTREPGGPMRSVAAAFARDVAKCRRLIVFSTDASTPTLPFLPLVSRAPRSTTLQPGDTSAIVSRHLGEELAAIFEDPDNTHTAVEREIERRATK